MNKTCKILAAAAFAFLGAQSAANAAVSYTYVGSWIVGDGPVWTSNPQVFSGQSAAAFLFGGNASDYAISTAGADPLSINHLTFLDGWGDTQFLNNPQSESFSVDLGAPGYNDPSGVGSAYSAFVLDHTCGNRYSNPAAACSGFGTQFVNYAFRINNVPEPTTTALAGLGLLGAVLARRRQKAK